jgi:nitroreductase
VRFIVLDDPVLKRALFHLTRESKDITNYWEGLFRPAGLRGYIQYWQATPFCIAVCADPRAGPQHIHNGWNHHLAAAENLALACRYFGLSLVMYTHFSQEKLKQLLDVSFDWDVMGMMGAGYPDLTRINPGVLGMSLSRLPLEEIVAEERLGRPAPAEILNAGEVKGPVADLMEAMVAARPVTRFTDRPVPAASLFEILRAAQWAPSAGNFQPIRYIVLRDRERLGRLADLAAESLAISGHWFPRYREGFSEHPDWTRVPVAVALIADPTKGGPHIHGEATHIHGGGIAAQNMGVMARALGLGTTLVTHWIEEKVKVLIDCPRTWDLVGVMPFGFPAEISTGQRKPLEELVYQDLFSRPWAQTPVSSRMSRVPSNRSTR